MLFFLKRELVINLIMLLVILILFFLVKGYINSWKIKNCQSISPNANNSIPIWLGLAGSPSRSTVLYLGPSLFIKSLLFLCFCFWAFLFYFIYIILRIFITTFFFFPYIFNFLHYKKMWLNTHLVIFSINGQSSCESLDVIKRHGIGYYKFRKTKDFTIINKLHN